MNFIPYESFIINTSLPLEEVKSILSRAVSDSDSVGKFVGSISDAGFRIKRFTWYANAFLPTLYGVLHKNHNGVQIYIKLMPRRSSLPFIIFWYAAAIYILINSIIRWDGTRHFGLKILFAIGMIIFLYFVIMLSWGLEASNARRFIKSLFPDVSRSSL